MMKKARKVFMEPSPSSSSFPIAGEDAKARFKHQSLLQDYADLFRATEAKRRKLQMIIAKKQKLKAEVKFLQRKYKSFTTNTPQEIPRKIKNKKKQQQSLNKEIPQSLRFTQPHNQVFAQPMVQPKNNYELPLQGRNQRAKDSNIPSSTGFFDLNQAFESNAEEMEEVQAAWDPSKVAKSKRCFIAHDLIIAEL